MVRVWCLLSSQLRLTAHPPPLTRSLALALALTFALDGQPLSFDNSRFLLLFSLLFLFCLLKLL